MTSNQYEVEFANRNGTPTKTTIDAGTEFEARKSVSRRPDFGSIIACRKMQGNVSNYTAGQNHEPLEHEMAEYVELEVTLRSKTTFGTDPISSASLGVQAGV